MRPVTGKKKSKKIRKQVRKIMYVWNKKEVS